MVVVFVPLVLQTNTCTMYIQVHFQPSEVSCAHYYTSIPAYTSWHSAGYSIPARK